MDAPVAETHLATFGSHRDLSRVFVKDEYSSILQAAKDEARMEIGRPEGALVEIQQRYTLYRTKIGADGRPYPVPDTDNTFTHWRVKVLVDFIMEGPAPTGAPQVPPEP